MLAIAIFMHALAGLARSSPIPQDEVTPVTVISSGGASAENVCNMTYENPDQTWRNSGAANFLDLWIQQNGANNWANRIDQQTTAHGSQAVSNLDCTSLLAGNCAFPSIQCRFFTPPALYHVRNAMSIAHSIMYALHEKWQDNAILQIIDINTIVSDFGPPPSSGLAGIFSGAFTTAAGATAPFVAAAGPLTIIAGAAGAVASAPGGGIDPTAAIESQLAQTFRAANEALSELAKTVFGGVGSTNQLPGAAFPGSNGEVTDIGKFFSGGKFLIGTTADGKVDSLVDKMARQGAKLLRQRLVNAALKAQNYYIWVDTTLDAAHCTSTGSRFIRDRCYQIGRFRGVTPHAQAEFTPIDAAIILKFDTTGTYDINLEDFYAIADDCQSEHPDFDGDLSTQNLRTDGLIPACFYNLPVIKAERSPCEAARAGVKLPENLGISEATCDEVFVCNPRKNECPGP